MNMWKNKVLEKIYRIREEYTKSFNLEALGESLLDFTAIEDLLN
jgi:hypothetical protein